MTLTICSAVLPVVKAQVASQVRVRDFSNVSFQISPAEHSSWAACLEAETINATKPLRAERQRALAAISSNLSESLRAAEVERIGAAFDGLENQKVVLTGFSQFV